jgi:RNA recognition motif-containing protein
MAIRLFVGSLSYGVDDAKLKDFFSEAGEVVSAKVITDRNTGQSKGFGFVEMSSDEEAKEAIKQLNDKELDGRKVVVNEAKPREERPQGSFRNGPSKGQNSFSSRRY